MIHAEAESAEVQREPEVLGSEPGSSQAEWENPFVSPDLLCLWRFERLHRDELEEPLPPGGKN